MPKSIVYRMLRPATEGALPLQLTCYEGQPDQLLAQLATHALDVVISDAPAPAHVRVKVFSHLLGESGITFSATAALARRVRRTFPQLLHDVPMLLPTSSTVLRSALEQWFDGLHIRPRVGGEFEDSALMKAFGEAGTAVFPAPSAIAREVCRHYGVVAIGQTDDVRERYYALSAERRVTHPGVVALTRAARGDVFPPGAVSRTYHGLAVALTRPDHSRASE